MQVWRLCVGSSSGACSGNMCTSDGGRDEAYANAIGARNTKHFASNAGTLQDHGVNDKLVVRSCA